MRRLIRAIWSMIDILMAVILAAMIALVFANVVLRYGFSSGIRQSVELARLWFVWVVMLGAAVVLRRGEHLAVAEFSESLMPRAVPILRRICCDHVCVRDINTTGATARHYADTDVRDWPTYRCFQTTPIDLLLW